MIITIFSSFSLIVASISGQRAAEVRCEDLWKNFSYPITHTEKRDGIIQGITFPPWYNTRQSCEIHITAPDGYFIKWVSLKMNKSRRESMSFSAICSKLTLNIDLHKICGIYMPFLDIFDIYPGYYPAT